MADLTAADRADLWRMSRCGPERDEADIQAFWRFVGWGLIGLGWARRRETYPLTPAGLVALQEPP